MKRLLHALVLLLGLSLPAEASFTLVTTATNSNGGSSGSIAAISIGSVTAGNLVVVGCGQDSATTPATITSVTDGGTTFTAATANTSSAASYQMYYATSSVSTGIVTYTCNYSVAVFTREIQVFVFSYTGTVSFDTEIATGAGASGTATASGNITTTGTDEMVFGAAYGENATAYTAQTINGSAATASVGIGVSTLYYLAAASTFTGQATATANTSGRWVSSMLAFKNTAAGGAAPKRLALTGVGDEL